LRSISISYGRQFFAKALLTILVPILALMAAAWHFGFRFKQEVDLAAFTTVPLLLIAILQLYRGQRSQQAAAIKEFIDRFRGGSDLYDTYFDLVYSYRNDVFAAMKQKAASMAMPSADNLPDFTPFESESKKQGRKPGSRLYLPGWFGLSPEERRLDALFDYFNTLAFYHDEGLVDMRDIARMLGDYLAVMANRNVVSDYLDYCQQRGEWAKTAKKSNAAEPYLYVRLLLDEFTKFNMAESSTLEIESLRQRIDEIKKREAKK